MSGDYVDQISYIWPSELAPAGQAALSRNCTEVVIGSGQWTAAYPEGFMNFTQYHTYARGAEENNFGC
jgi:hypothetical protein